MSKKALIVGINYNGSSAQLNGCINDADNMLQELKKQGYSEEHIRLLTDDTFDKPTRSNILKGLLTLILSGASRLFFHYSGHGASVYDRNGDEEDGRDETLVPIDYEENGLILDDEIRGILCCLREDQKLTCVMDCCHSGTGMDLTYNLFERYGGRYLTMKADSKHLPTRGQCIMISGCQDSQTSADAFIGNEYKGAMTHSFLKSINEPKTRTYEDLIRRMRKILETEGYTQIPNLSSGRNLHLRSNIVI